MEKNHAQLRSWLVLVSVGLLLATICFVVFGFTHVVSPVTAIGNTAGFLVTSLIAGLLALRKLTMTKRLCSCTGWVKPVMFGTQ